MDVELDAKVEPAGGLSVICETPDSFTRGRVRSAPKSAPIKSKPLSVSDAEKRCIRGRSKSVEELPTWTRLPSIHIALTSPRGPSDRRGISVEIDWGRRHFACSIELRRLLFWFIMLLALAPIKSLTLGGSPPPQRSVVSGLHRTPAPVAASLAASLPRGCDAEMALGAAFANNSDTGVAAINQHVTCSSLDELSLVILREACGTVGVTDDGTFFPLVNQVLHGVHTQELFSVDALKKTAIRSLVSMGMHKIALTSWPAVACALHLPADTPPLM